MPDPAPIEGFTVYFDRHRRRWCWREKKPAKNAKKRGFHVQGCGYLSRGHAYAGVRLELGRRDRG